jgi:lycopene beta-cyclase
MSNEPLYDLAILGGGCAGLALAQALAKQQAPQKVVIIEPRTAYTDDRSWCFWASDSHGLDHLVSKTWPRWACTRQGQFNTPYALDAHSYQYIRSIDFYQACLAAIERHRPIELKRGQAAGAVQRCERDWRIQCGDVAYRARAVLDTRPVAPELIDQATMVQCFAGVEIELPDGQCVDDRVVELMTNMRLVDGDFCFDYVLPLSTNRVLAEATFFSRQRLRPEQLEHALESLLQRRGWQTARVIRREQAALPMGLGPLAPEPDGLVHAGMAGGALRPSSGYGFMRIQTWAQACAAQFLKTGRLVKQTKSSPVIEAMDAIFLKVLQRQPHLAPSMFDALFSQVQPASLVRFMNDNASWRDCLRVVASQPKWPFLKALITKRQVH